MSESSRLLVSRPDEADRQLAELDRSDLVIGIPSFNEADTIGHVVRQADRGLERYPRLRGAIVNCDNASPDGTREAFLGTDTRSPKLYLSTPDGVRGKGNNFWNLFLAARQLGARAVVVVDADLESIEPGWIEELGGPILEGDADYVTPIYARNEYDGTITNHICYPLLYALLGTEVRQPIGGDFGLSGDFLDRVLEQDWTDTTREYGIDIFLTLNALLGGRRIEQRPLGAKIHKPSAPKLGPMFTQVVTTLFGNLLDHREHWELNGAEVRAREADGLSDPQRLAVDYKVIKTTALVQWAEQRPVLEELLDAETFERFDQRLQGGPMRIGAGLWSDAVFELLHAFDRSDRDERVIEATKPLFFARVASFIRSTLDLDHAASEERIIRQARLFRRNRKHLLNRYDQPPRS